MQGSMTNTASLNDLPIDEGTIPLAVALAMARLRRSNCRHRRACSSGDESNGFLNRRSQVESCQA